MTKFLNKPLEDLVDDALEGRLKPQSIIDAVIELKAEDLRKLADPTYSISRAVVAQLLRSARTSTDAVAWREALLWLRGKFSVVEEAVIATRLETLSDLLDDRLRLTQWFPLAELLARDHVRALLRLLLDKGGRAKREEVRTALRLKEANLTRVLSLLETHGLIEREARGRSRILVLTASGRQALRRGKTVRRQQTAAMEPVWTRNLPAPPPLIPIRVDAPTSILAAQLPFARRLGLDKHCGIEIVAAEAAATSADHSKSKSEDRPHIEARIATSDGSVDVNAGDGMAVFLTNTLPQVYALEVPSTGDLPEPIRDRLRNLLGRADPEMPMRFLAIDATCYAVAKEFAHAQQRPIDIERISTVAAIRDIALNPRDRRFLSIVCYSNRSASRRLKVFFDRIDCAPRIVNCPRPLPLRQCLRAALRVNVDPVDWQDDRARAQEIVSSTYRLASALTRHLRSNIDEFAEYLESSCVGRERYLASIGRKRLSEYLRNGYKWWGQETDNVTTATLLAEASGELITGSADATSAQVMGVRAFEESRLNEVWELHNQILERTMIHRTQKEYDAWFDATLRHQVEAGAWRHARIVLMEVEKRLKATAAVESTM